MFAQNLQKKAWKNPVRERVVFIFHLYAKIASKRKKNKKKSNRRRTLFFSIRYERFMHLAKVPIFVRRIMFELRLTPDIPFHNRRFLTPVLCVSSLPTQPFLFSRRFQRFHWERTQVKKRARRTARSVYSGTGRPTRC